MAKFPLSMVLCLLVQLLVAQSSIDLLTVSYRYGPAQSLEGASGSAVENVLFVNAKLPIVFSDQNIWYNDLTYQGSYVGFSDGAVGEEPIALQQLILQTGWVRQLNESTALQLLFVPRLMSDFHNVDSDHFQFGGIGLYEKKFSDQLLMRFGAMANSDRFGPMIVPLVYADWKMSSRWTFTGLIPIYAKLGYKVSDRLTVGASQFGLITSFQMGNPDFSDSYIERKSIDLSLFARYQLFGNFYAEPRVGYAVGRSYRQFATGDQMDYRVAIVAVGDDRIQQNKDFKPGMIFDLRFVYNLPLD